MKQLVDEFKDTGKWYTELAFEYPEELCVDIKNGESDPEYVYKRTEYIEDVLWELHEKTGHYYIVKDWDYAIPSIIGL